MENSRTVNSKLNVYSNIFLLVVVSILTFVVRTLFVKILGGEYLGLNGLFTNILSMLSISELGLTSAIGFSLYKYLNKNDYNNVSVIMTFYKKLYNTIGIIILLLGLLITPFLGFFIKSTSISNYQWFFLIYLFDTVFSYFVCYKDILLSSDQKNYESTKIRFCTTIIMYGLEAIALILFKNYFYYLLSFAIINNISKIAIYIYISKKYTNINYFSENKLNKDDFVLINKNIKALFIHRFGDYLVNGTDNILISKLVSLVVVGIYSNYISLISIIKSLISTIYSAIIASFGNLIVNENKDIQENVFLISDLICICISGLFSICFYNGLSIFINLWLGNDYVLNSAVVIFIIFNFYLYAILLPVETLKSASGFYDKDKYVTILQAFINLLFSIVLGKIYGLIGIVIGTTISYILTVNWIKPYFIYKFLFKKSSKNYFIREIKNLIVIIISILVSNIFSAILIPNSLFFKFIIFMVLSIVIYVFIFYLFFRKDKNFIYIKKEFATKLLNKKNKLFN